jgi:formate-dependent nitrite reductase membrane component NrfD
MTSISREPGQQRAFVNAPLIPPTVQERWDVPHATWFTLMGIGGGVFLLARLLGVALRLGLVWGLPLVDLVSFVAIAVGGLILVADLGRPLRFIRAVMKPGTSWISRGAIADFVFLVAGGVLILPGLVLGGGRPFAWLPWDPSGTGGAGKTVEAIALLSAAVVIFYAGQVLADNTAIPYWRSPAVPIQFVLSSLAMSMALVMVMEAAHGEPIGAGQCGLLLGFLALLLVAMVWHLRTDPDAPGKRESLQALLRGKFRVPFLGGVVALGTVLPLGLAALGLLVPPARGALASVCLVATLGAGFSLRLITLRVGIFPPVRLTLGAPLP